MVIQFVYKEAHMDPSLREYFPIENFAWNFKCM